MGAGQGQFVEEGGGGALKLRRGAGSGGGGAKKRESVDFRSRVVGISVTLCKTKLVHFAILFNTKNLSGTQIFSLSHARDDRNRFHFRGKNYKCSKMYLIIGN